MAKLRVGTSNGTEASITMSPSFAVVVVSEERYRVYWDDVGAASMLDRGDRFTVARDDRPLPLSTNFTFYLKWGIDVFVATANWTTPSIQKPVVYLTQVGYSSGNATLTIVDVSEAVSIVNYRVNLNFGIQTGTAVEINRTTGGFGGSATITIGSTAYRIYWIDLGGEAYLSPGDILQVTGDSSGLPAGSYTFFLLWSFDGSLIASRSWTIS